MDGEGDLCNFQFLFFVFLKLYVAQDVHGAHLFDMHLCFLELSDIPLIEQLSWWGCCWCCVQLHQMKLTKIFFYR